jgi:hypothetical protein
MEDGITNDTAMPGLFSGAVMVGAPNTRPTRLNCREPVKWLGDVAGMPGKANLGTIPSTGWKEAEGSCSSDAAPASGFGSGAYILRKRLVSTRRGL